MTEKKITLAELVYCLYFAIMLFAKGIGLYEGMKAYTLCLLVGTGLIVIKMLLTKHTVADLAAVVLLLALGVAIYLTNGERSALIYLLMIAGLKAVSVRRVFKVGLMVWLGTFAVQLFVSLLGIRQDLFFIHKKFGEHIIRWSLGYPHPNVLHISYFILLAFILYFMKMEKRHIWKGFLVMFLGNIYIFLYSMSYTGFLLTTVFLMLYLYFGVRKEFSKVEKLLIQAVVPFCTLFSVLGPLLIKGRLFDLINSALNTRFYLSYYFLTTQKIGLFGTSDFQVPDSSYNLDCSYTNALFHEGIVFLVLMVTGLTILVHYLLKNNKRTELAIVLGIAIAGISEPFLVNTSYKNLAFLFLGEMIFVYLERYVQKKPNTLWAKQICLFGNVGERPVWGDPRLSGKAAGMKETCAYVWKKRKDQLMILALCSAVAIGVVYRLNVNVPDKIYALLWSCDRKDDTGKEFDEQYVYLDRDNLPEDFNGLILNYKDTETPLYDFDGITVQFEYFRRALSFGLLGGIGAFMVGYFVCFVKRSGCAIMSRENKKDSKQV